MSLAPPIFVALWTGGITVGLMAAVGTGADVARRIRRGDWRWNRINPGIIFASLLVMAVPAAFALPLAAIGFAALADAPPVAFLFVALAGLACLGPALAANGYGMEGCQKILGIFVALYVAVWGLVAFWFVGGIARLAADGASLVWLKPPAAALPLALVITAIVGRKRTIWTFPLALFILSAVTALLYFPVEAGLAAAWLPARDWLRFPLAGFTAGLVISSPWALPIARLKGAARRKALRFLPGQTLIFAIPLATTGLGWAAARAAITQL